MANNQIVAGFPEMWQPVYYKYKPFFDCAAKLQPIVDAMVKVPLKGELQQMVGRMATAAFNSMGALMLLTLNGYGHDAKKIARSLFEIELNILRLKAHPDEIADFVDYNIIQQKQIYDMMDEDQQQAVPRKRYEQMMRDYNAVLPRFASKRNPTVPRTQWCKDSIYARAKEAGPDYLSTYHTFYGPASSLSHLDIGGIIANTDANMEAHMAPSWELVEESLIGMGYALRSIQLWDEMAGLGFQQQIADGPEADLVNALTSINSARTASPGTDLAPAESGSPTSPATEAP